MSGPDAFAFRMSNAAAASPANPPPTICAFIRPSRPQRELRACRRPPSASADALILQALPLRGSRSRSSDRDHTTSEWRDKDVQANPGFLRLQTFAAHLASRRIEERKHADERDDDAAERDFRCAGCA